MAQQYDLHIEYLSLGAYQLKQTRLKGDETKTSDALLRSSLQTSEMVPSNSFGLHTASIDPATPGPL
jgi:hypothetical protein